MKKARNDKIDGRFYSDEYISTLTGQICKLQKENKQLQNKINNAIEYIKENNFSIDYDSYDFVESAVETDVLLKILGVEDELS